MLISHAYAAGSDLASEPNILGSLLPIILIFLVFYFFLLRPQQKRMREHKDVIENLKKGDRVVTGGGAIATVKKVNNESQVTVELTKGVEVTLVRGTVQGLWEGPSPVVANTNTTTKKNKSAKTTKKTAKKK
jgi:preprotein translocase subunit YajC